MSKELEALENLCNQCEFYQFEKGKNPKKCPFNKNCVFRNRIENALKRLEELEIMYSNCVIEGAKQKKALEIINTKNVAITIIKQTNNVVEYNAFAYDFLQIKRADEEKYKLSPQPLIHEEYKLLKEVLK